MGLPELLNLDLFKQDLFAVELLKNSEALEQIGIELKYEGYVNRQNDQIKMFMRSESTEIPEDFNYDRIKSLSTEGKEKLNLVKPRSLGQASRIAGVSPADISILTIYMKG